MTRGVEKRVLRLIFPVPRSRIVYVERYQDEHGEGGLSASPLLRPLQPFNYVLTALTLLNSSRPCFVSVACFVVCACSGFLCPLPLCSPASTSTRWPA
jgi:hypothetical protein